MTGDTGTIRRIATIAVVVEIAEGCEWLVASLGSSDDMGIYEVLFRGPLAKERALEYAAEKYSGYRFI